MSITPKRLTTTSCISLSDLLQKLYKTIENLKQNHENDIEILNKRISDLENENKRLHGLQEQHPHSIFDIDYIPNESSTVNQLRTELKHSEAKIDALQKTLDEKCSEYEDMKSKYSLQRLMNENHQNSHTDSSKIKEFEAKFQQIKDQINQFDQCNYESEEQIRLLKQILITNDQNKTQTQSLTVKQSDLSQQTDYVENLLNKQHDKILNKIMELLDQNPRQEPTLTTKTKKAKKKRL
ncbi:hypothetical protein I4U23_030965 [Adineta vaga]|nr:hypothetical protein I4U23_030965 [Adineta vaga]